MNSELVISDVLRGEKLDLRKIDLTIPKRVCGVYAIYCEPEAKYYVGSSINIYARVREHFWYIKGDQWSNKNLCEAGRKHGAAAFYAFILEECEPKELETLEQKWAKMVGFERLYNYEDRPVLRQRKHILEYKIEGEMTIEELRIDLRKKPRAFQVAWKKCGLVNYAKFRAATQYEIERMRNYYIVDYESAQNHKKVKNVTSNNMVASEPTAPRKEAKPRFTLPDISTVRRVLLDIILVGIVVGHAGLIWYDCSDLWDMPGQIGGGLAFFIIVAAVMLATDPAKNITSQIALFFAFLVDFAAWWVHYPVFQTYSVPDEITGVLCAFLCLMSFGALLIYRHQKNN